MNKISCDICMDLMPLVKDGVASEDSCNAVTEHINQCEECKKIFEEIPNNNIEFDDKKVISKIKNRLIVAGLILILVGSIIGVILSESENMFYNVLIMPIIGGVSYFVLRKKSYVVPLIMFGFVYVYHFIKYIFELEEINVNQIISLVPMPLMWSIVYSCLCALGILIGFLLYIAFRREKK
ncbi:MAG: zf-HC2 domain-containing protein [Romboutsia sp.]|uniref:zf-HC2 domain-containing protein n=1 Tax=Romboutsia sp. TaxID=1965302 RepID=UPI003F3A3B73